MSTRKFESGYYSAFIGASIDLWADTILYMCDRPALQTCPLLGFGRHSPEQSSRGHVYGVMFSA